MNKWQIFWRSLDEARFIVRVMLVVKLAALILYVFASTAHFHAVVSDALNMGGATWADLVPVLTAVTAFYSITIPVLSKLYLNAWTDYRQSGTDWQSVAAQAAEAQGGKT